VLKVTFSAWYHLPSQSRGQSYIPLPPNAQRPDFPRREGQFRIECDDVGKVGEGLTYFPQLEQEQLEPQLQLEAPEHPHSPFMVMV